MIGRSELHWAFWTRYKDVSDILRFWWFLSSNKLHCHSQEVKNHVIKNILWAKIQFFHGEILILSHLSEPFDVPAGCVRKRHFNITLTESFGVKGYFTVKSKFNFWIPHRSLRKVTEILIQHWNWKNFTLLMLNLNTRLQKFVAVPKHSFIFPPEEWLQVFSRCFHWHSSNSILF